MEQYIFWVVTSLLTFIAGKLWHLMRKTQHDNNSIKNGIQAILRDDIIRTYNNCNKAGYVHLYELENITKMYSAYHALGGNNGVTELYQKFLALPTKEGNEH